jgi:hypothetical protein
MESLWNAIDDRVASTLLSALGEDSDYESLVVKGVHRWATFDLMDLASIEMPACIVMSFESTAQFSRQGSTIRDKKFPVVVIGIVQGSLAQASADIKTLGHRIEKALAELSVAGVVADDGSTARKFSPGEIDIAENISIWQKPSSENLRYAAISVAFEVGGRAV